VGGGIPALLRLDLGQRGVLLVTGFFMIFNAFGGFRQTPMFVNLMMALGILMMLLFAYVFFLPYPRCVTASRSMPKPKPGWRCVGYAGSS